MQFGKTEDILASIVDILKHIERVQKDVMALTERSSAHFCDFIEANQVPADEKMLQAFQYQDIITQQLGAASEAIVTVEKNIAVYLHAAKQDQNLLSESIEKLAAKLAVSLRKAREKQEAFSGNAFGTGSAEVIEFF
jgi:hypothetical protein